MSGTMKFDGSSIWELRWGATDESVIKNGLSFVAFEKQRPLAEQLKDISAGFMQVLVMAAQDAAVEAGQGEVERARAAEAVRQADAQLRPLMEKVLLHLKSRHANNLAELEKYTLNTTVGARGISVTKPKNLADWRTFCIKYTELEGALPAEQQISDPPLSQLVAIANTLQTNTEDRSMQTTRRQRNVATRTMAAERLQDALQAAAAVIMVKCFDGHVTRDLQQWGYDVVAKNGSAEKPEEPETPENPA